MPGAAMKEAAHEDADLIRAKRGPGASRFVKSDDIREAHGDRYVDVA
jgi:hypothetical protein